MTERKQCVFNASRLDTKELQLGYGHQLETEFGGGVERYHEDSELRRTTKEGLSEKEMKVIDIPER